MTITEISYSTLEPYFLESFEEEISRVLSDDRGVKIKEYLLQRYFTNNHYCITKEYFEDLVTGFTKDPPILRDFIYELTDRYMFKLSHIPVVKDILVNLVLNALVATREFNDIDATLLGPDFNNELKSGYEFLDNIIEDNFWLVTFMLIIVYMPKTSIYKKFMEDRKKLLPVGSTA